MSETTSPVINCNFVRLVKDGKAFVAWIGDDPQVGLMATADSQPVALFVLAFKMKIFGWECAAELRSSDFVPSSDRTGVLLHRVESGQSPILDYWTARIVERGFFWEAQFGHEPWRALASVAVMMVEREFVVQAQEVA